MGVLLNTHRRASVRTVYQVAKRERQGKKSAPCVRFLVDGHERREWNGGWYSAVRALTACPELFPDLLRTPNAVDTSLQYRQLVIPT